MREEAHALLENILEKNNESEDGRKVCLSFNPLSPHTGVHNNIWRTSLFIGMAYCHGEADKAKISVIVEMVAGRVTDMLLKMIALYRPDCE